MRGGVVLLQLHRFWKCVLTRAGYSYDLGDIWWVGVGVLVSFARGGVGCVDGAAVTALVVAVGGVRMTLAAGWPLGWDGWWRWISGFWGEFSGVS